jgi:hypothetical protein
MPTLKSKLGQIEIGYNGEYVRKFVEDESPGNETLRAKLEETFPRDRMNVTLRNNNGGSINLKEVPMHVGQYNNPLRDHLLGCGRLTPEYTALVRSVFG